MSPLPKLSYLTPDNRIWRVDWFGDCGYPAHIRRYAQPSIKVVLSPVRATPDDDALLRPDGTDHQHPYEAWAPISALPLLAVGDLWQNGRQIASPDYQIETFKALAVSTETTVFVKSGLAINEQFLLPLNQHPWHRSHTQAYCVAVELGEGRRLLVPCVELIRFYFGSSGNLIQRLFTQPLASNSLWTEKQFDTTAKHLHLVLANRLSGVSASDIGRIANSKFAWRAAAGIFASCQKAAVQQHPVYPYTGFPFEGATKLVASGIWLPFGETENATFLVYKLRSCSHPFPFRTLSYEAGDKKVWHSSSNGPGNKGTKFSRTQEKTGEIIDTDPANHKKSRSANFTSKHHFPDLVRKQVWREKFESIGKVDIFLRHADGSMEQIAFGESDVATGPAGIHIEADSEKKDNGKLPWFVREGIKIIKREPRYAGATIKVVCPTGKTKPIFHLPMVVSEDGEIDQTLLVTLADGRTRSRQGCFVEMPNDITSRQYMLILESWPYPKPPSIISTQEKTFSVELISRVSVRHS